MVVKIETFKKPNFVSINMAHSLNTGADKLKVKYGDLVLYNAGLPHFPRNFSRDSIISAILAGDMKALRDQLFFCTRRQGIKKNSLTGQEPGKIHHEYDFKKQGGWILKGRGRRTTEYNACDTTALYLIGHWEYYNLTGDTSLAKAQVENIREGLGYIRLHVKDGLFIESPAFSGSKKYALKVTFWKDSAIHDRRNGEPTYPVVYTLAHVQNMYALRKTADLVKAAGLDLDKQNPENLATSMSKGLEKLYDHELGTFYIAVDARGSIRGVSSDSLHALDYLEPGDLQEDQLERIVRASTELETPAGYRALSPKLSDKLEDKYHVSTIWPFEQAIIHKGAVKFGLKKVQEVSKRVVPYLNTNPEIFELDGTEVKKGGCDPQLWTIAAKSYFSQMKR